MENIQSPSRSTDLNSLFQVYMCTADSKDKESLIREFCITYSNSFSSKENNAKQPVKRSEFNELAKITQQLLEIRSFGMSSMKQQGFFLNCVTYSGVREEFDVLRFGKSSILNLELKSKKPKKDIEYQLRSHQHLLSILGQPIHLFAYIAEEDKLFRLDKKDQLVESSMEELCDSIDSNFQSRNLLDDIDFSSMLISPYSEPQKFSRHKYFLTSEQIDICNNIIASPKKLKSISGGPGTGKTLLLFDIAKKMKHKGKRILIIFVAKLSHKEQSDFSEFLDVDIISIHDFTKPLADKYDVILIDEAQRLWENNYEDLISLQNKCLIFSVDHNQTLHPAERNLNIEEKLIENADVENFWLNTKFRNNPSMSSFIQKFLNLKAPKVQPEYYPDVSAVFFNSELDATNYIKEKVSSEEKFVPIEPTQYITKTTSNLKRKHHFGSSIATHSTIGREYDNILIPIDNYYFYDSDAKLDSSYTNYPYLEHSLLFEALTRVRKKLIIVVIQNIPVYQTVLEILNWKDGKLQK